MPQVARNARKEIAPTFLFPFSIFLFLFFGVGENFILAIVAIIVFVVGFILLWRPGESPVLLFTFVFPWLQVTIPIFRANWNAQDVNQTAQYFGADLQSAIPLALTGLLTFAAGMRVGAGPSTGYEQYALRAQALSQPFLRWRNLYLLGWAISFVCLSLAFIVPGLSQLLLGAAAIKWTFFYILAFAVFVGVPNGKQQLAVIFLLELGSSIGGYFSDFKTVFIITAFAALASGTRFSPKALVGIGLLTVVTFFFGVVWQTVKGDYRNFVSGGEAAQIVTVDYTTRIYKLGELLGNIGTNELGDGLDRFLSRLSYVDYFGVVLNYVPDQTPHENGAITWDAVTRPFMPRLFFPSKTIIDDSVRTNQYTGLGVSGADQGTSISLGWIPEMYIDFGVIGIYPSVFLIGIFFGLIYRAFLSWAPSRGLLGVGISTAILVSVGDFGNSFTKTFGGVVASLLAAWLLIRYVIPRWVPWLIVKSTGPGHARPNSYYPATPGK